jgi:hypothetical protein
MPLSFTDAHPMSDTTGGQVSDSGFMMHEAIFVIFDN